MPRVCSCGLLLGALVSPAAVLQSQTAADVVGKYYQAAGGLDKMKAVNAMRVTGRMTMGQGMEAPFTRITKRPNLVRVEFTVQGMTGIQAFDGQTGWMLMPFMGQTAPQLMPGDLTKTMQEEAEFDGPLVDYQARGIQVDLVGKEQVEGADAYKLKVTLKGGDVSYYYLDAKTYLPLRAESQRTFQGQQFNIVSVLGDYRSEGGLMIPHSLQVSGQGPGAQTFVIEKVELNPSLKDDDFKMPSKPGG